jgi:hypothetical protein
MCDLPSTQPPEQFVPRGIIEAFFRNIKKILMSVDSRSRLRLSVRAPKPDSFEGSTARKAGAFVQLNALIIYHFGPPNLTPIHGSCIDR